MKKVMILKRQIESNEKRKSAVKIEIMNNAPSSGRIKEYVLLKDALICQRSRLRELEGPFLN